MRLAVTFITLVVSYIINGMNVPHNDVKFRLSNELNKGLLKALVQPNSWTASMKGPLALSVKYKYLYPLDVSVNHQSEDMESCNKLYQRGNTVSSVYVIRPRGFRNIDVYCYMKNGGWTVFQRRLNGKIDFYRTWKEYKNGFGDLNGEFWLGNDALSALTKTGDCQLWIDLEDFSNVTKYAVYEKFKVDDESHGYKLNIGKYHGNTGGDSLSINDGMKFTTKDKDQDTKTGNCAELFNVVEWWYTACHHANLNGQYLGGVHQSHADGINWLHWHGYNYSLKATTMMLKCE